MPIRTKRVYEPASTEDGTRFLVDRVWPRGIAKARAAVEAWLPEVGPSHDLRRWFGHDPAKWPEFKKRYFVELRDKTELWEPIRIAAAIGVVTLVYSARDVTHNQAVALAEYLQRGSRSTRRK